MKKGNKRNWNKALWMSFALLSAGVMVQAAEMKSPDMTAPREPAQRAPDSTGVEPAVPDTGNSRTTPGVAAPAEINKTNTDIHTNTEKIKAGTPSSSSQELRGGVIESVSQTDANSSVVRVRDANGQVRDVTVDGRTSVYVNNKKTAVSDVKAGDQVRFKRNSANKK